ncbi:TIGR04282 family arsenosugar biosynthesis glycosyltransferase [Pontibacter rugosus]|uniref:TIGR04282 family arsenosugar biosynthesis glycosyltransferase n=1 Tax=Pontibacter rugosus TaxID=1745966 RepID=A0ABW3SQ92_9BACT
MTSKKLLLLFVRNPELGKVKTRLAATLGQEKALEIYIKLLNHTRSITEQLPVHKLVYYTDNVTLNDQWPDHVYEKRVQPAGDLGDKMQAAFAAGFEEGYTSIVIIGSDCWQLSQEVIEEAYKQLEQQEVVLGPALDGGYYLLGTKRLHPQLFQNKRWSTAHVFPDTIQDLKQLQLTYSLLPRLSDVDYAEDLDDELLK